MILNCYLFNLTTYLNITYMRTILMAYIAGINIIIITNNEAIRVKIPPIMKFLVA